jgi:hypothetical protein
VVLKVADYVAVMFEGQSVKPHERGPKRRLDDLDGCRRAGIVLFEFGLETTLHEAVLTLFPSLEGFCRSDAAERMEHCYDIVDAGRVRGGYGMDRPDGLCCDR